MNSTQEDKQQLLRQLWQALRDKRLSQAISASNLLTGRFPQFAPGWYASSHLAQSIKQPRKALLAIDRALRLESGHADWHLHRAACLLKCGELALARKTLERFCADPDDRGLTAPAQLSQLAFLCNQAAMHEESAALYSRLTSLEPNDGGHWYNLATIQRFLGLSELAESSLENAIALNPKDYEAYELRADLRTQTAESNHVDQLETMLAKGIGLPAGEVRICYTLAKELEDLGEHERAFGFLMRGAALRRRHIQYRLQDDLDTMQALEETFGPAFFAQNIHGQRNSAPIFVIGLPRTGTTLLERILGSHSQVTAVGELHQFAEQLTTQLGTEKVRQSATRVELVRRSAELDFEQLGRSYLASVQPLTGRTKRFVDKMPLNFLYAGLIHAALPEATIIHVRRHPMDTCYAIYKRLFGHAYPWSYDLREIAAYYTAYRKLMAHWNNVLPGVIHEVHYEQLVNETEQVTRRLLGQCGLAWEDNCSQFHQQAQASTTASASQVRQPVYDSSVGLWRRYEKQLKPLAEILHENGIDLL
jgi:tetratricopeptide (TPR) repeat protein